MISRCCWLLVANDTPHSEVYVSLQNRRTIPWAHGIEISSTTHSCASNLRCKFSNQTEIWRWPPYEIETHFFSDVNRCHSCNGCASSCHFSANPPLCPLRVLRSQLVSLNFGSEEPNQSVTLLTCAFRAFHSSVAQNSRTANARRKTRTTVREKRTKRNKMHQNAKKI